MRESPCQLLSPAPENGPLPGHKGEDQQLFNLRLGRQLLIAARGRHGRLRQRLGRVRSSPLFSSFLGSELLLELHCDSTNCQRYDPFSRMVLRSANISRHSDSSNKKEKGPTQSLLKFTQLRLWLQVIDRPLARCWVAACLAVLGATPACRLLAIASQFTGFALGAGKERNDVTDRRLHFLVFLPLANVCGIQKRIPIEQEKTETNE